MHKITLCTKLHEDTLGSKLPYTKLVHSVIKQNLYDINFIKVDLFSLVYLISKLVAKLVFCI